MLKDKSVGSEKEVYMVVGENDTAIALGSGSLPVLATPRMTALMEAAASKLIEECLLSDAASDACSVGIGINIDHSAATPVGLKVTAKAKIVGVNGRKVSFEIEAFDEKERIGGGTHERFIVFGDKFIQKIEDKLK